MHRTKGSDRLASLRKNASLYRNRKYRRKLKSGPVSPRTAILPVDQEWRDRFQLARRRGKQPMVFLIDAIHRYCDTFLKPTQSAVRFRSNRNLYLRIAEVLGPNKFVHELDEADLTRYRDHILEAGYSVSSANRYVSAINALLAVCRDNWKIIDEAPLISSLKINPRAFRYLSESEEERLLSRCSEHLRRLVIFILGTGARKSEATNLTWGDVFIDGVPRGWVRFTKTKNGKPHSVPLPNHVREMLATMRLERPTNLDFVFWHFPSRDCRDREGKVISKKGVASPYLWPNRDFDVARGQAGLSDVRIHDLRHTYASRLVMKGVSLVFINKLLNHADLEQTARYAHFSIDQLSNSVSVLDRREDLGIQNRFTPPASRYEGIL